MKYILLLTLLTGCGPICSKDPNLSTYLTAFVHEFDTDAANVCSMSYTEFESDVRLGEANIIPFVRCDITIATGLLPWTKRAVIYHEILHCMGYEHVDNPKHIMYRNMQSEWDYPMMWEQTIREIHTLLLEGP